MSIVTIDPGTGSLVIDGSKVFPIVFSNPPPIDGLAPSGANGYAELAAAGASFIRTGRGDWKLATLEQQIAQERAQLDAAATHGLHCWLWLGDVPNLPPATAGSPPSANEQMLERIVTELGAHPALGAYKGIDEPRNPFRGPDWIRPAGMLRAYKRLKALDPSHPMVITQAPRGAVADLVPYRTALDITGADIYPVSYPPGVHAATANKDISVVGDITRKMRQAAGPKPIWMTLQIAWSGVVPSHEKPGTVPRFPTLHEERFMVYQAIANGARGVVFFGGHRVEVARPVDARAGWNWTFFEIVLRPILRELISTAVAPALVAPDSTAKITASAGDIELVARRTDAFLYVIAVRRGGSTTRVELAGLPNKKNGAPITGGQVLFEYVQAPPSPPVLPEKQAFRSISVSGGRFRDWFGPHDAHIYRFPR